MLIKYRVHASSVVASRTRQCWEACDWAVACMRARRAGRPEPSREEFLRERAAQPWWQRLSRERAMLARVNYRVAGLEIGSGHWLRGGCRLLLTACLMPGYVLGRLASQVALPGRRRPPAHPLELSLN